MRYRAIPIEFGQPEISILMNGDRIITSRFARDQVQLSRRSAAKRLFGIAWSHTSAIRLNPDLQQMHGLITRRIELAVLNTRSRGHVLDIARADYSAVAHRILVLERAAE